MPPEARKRRKRAPYEIERVCLINRRPVYGIKLLRNRLTGEQTQELLSRFDARILFPIGMQPPREALARFRGFDEFRNEVLVLSAAALLKGVSPKRVGRLCVADRRGGLAAYLHELVGRAESVCVLTDPALASVYGSASDRICRNDNTAIPLYFSADRVGSCGAVIDADGGELPHCAAVFSAERSADTVRAIVPYAALPAVPYRDFSNYSGNRVG